MALLATLSDHRRAAERQGLDSDATLRIDGRPFDALVANISTTGCLFVCAEALAVGDTVTIGVTGIGRRDARIVRALDSRFGAEFEVPLTGEEIVAAAAMPTETVVTFPLPVAGSSPLTEPDPPSPPSLGASARLLIVAGLAASTWLAAATLLRALG